MLRAEGWLPNDLFLLRKDEKDIWNMKKATKESYKTQMIKNIFDLFSQ